MLSKDRAGQAKGVTFEVTELPDARKVRRVTIAKSVRPEILEDDEGDDMWLVRESDYYHPFLVTQRLLRREASGVS